MTRTFFRPLIDYTATFCKIPYKGSFDPGERSDTWPCVMADHIRAIAFTIADGTIPAISPVYVIRRILRRAVRYYYSFISGSHFSGVLLPFSPSKWEILSRNQGAERIYC
ncbi:MAG: alanine--tRNA ligase-related protein [Saprospiraceae bacterium]